MARTRSQRAGLLSYSFIRFIIAVIVRHDTASDRIRLKVSRIACVTDYTRRSPDKLQYRAPSRAYTMRVSASIYKGPKKSCSFRERNNTHPAGRVIKTRLFCVIFCVKNQIFHPLSSYRETDTGIWLRIPPKLQRPTPIPKNVCNENAGLVFPRRNCYRAAGIAFFIALRELSLYSRWWQKYAKEFFFLP